MPVAKGPSFDIRSAVILGGIAVVAALLIGLVAVRLGQQSGRLVLGDVDFSSLEAQNMADEISENGPILWPDVGSGSRDIWLQHLSDDVSEGWVAFDARNPERPRECNVRWLRDDQQFEDPCTGDVYPPSGDGLPSIPVFVEGSELVIDLNNLRSASSTG